MTIRDIAIAFGYTVDKNSEKKVNDSIDKLASTASKLLGAIAVVFSIKGLKDLAEAAANVEALDSQFKQVFGDVEDDATKALKKIADETGVNANRMRASFTQIAAFAKTTGLDSAGALGISERAMAAVADSAAFYDRSIEDVTASLQSFLKGNYANDAALGLSATEFTRNAKAAELYGKKFTELSEAQKQMTLLQMVEDANALSGAIGQAARESDTWTNQLGNLKQGMQDLKAAAGRSFLKPAVQVIKLLTRLVSTLADGLRDLTAEGKPLNKMFSAMSDRIAKITDFIGRFVDRMGGAENVVKTLGLAIGAIVATLAAIKIGGAIKSAGGILKLLGKMNPQFLLIAAAIAVIALLIEDLIGFMNGKDSFLGKMFEKFGIDGEQVKQTIRDIMAAGKEFLGVLLGLGKGLGSTLLKSLKQLLPSLIEMGKKILPLIFDLFKRIGPIVMNLGKSVLTTLFNALVKIIPILFQVVEQVLPVIVGLMERLIPFIARLAETVLPLIVQLIETLLPMIVQFIESALPVILQLIEAIIPVLFQIIDTVLPIIIQLIETLLPLILQIVETVLPVILELIVALLPIILQIVETVLPIVLEFITAILPLLMPIVELIASLVSALLPPIVKLLDAILPILEPILKILDPIADVLGIIIDALATVVGWVADGLTWIIGLFTGEAGDVNINSSGGEPVPGYAGGTSRAPDTFIAGEEGPELITGARGRKVFTNAQTGDIAQTLKAIMQMGAAPSPDTIAATSTSVDNRSVTQYNEFSNTFHGDRAGQKKSAAAAERSANDATDLMSRALQYAR